MSDDDRQPGDLCRECGCHCEAEECMCWAQECLFCNEMECRRMYR